MKENSVLNVLKKAFAFILFVALLAIVVLKVYDIIRWKDTNGDYTSTTEQLYNTEDNLIDVVFVGSSHVYCDIYPAFIWEKSGIAAFDMSVSGQDKDSAYHHLKELLKTQSPKVVFVDLYPLFSDRIGIEGNVYRNMLALKTSENSYSLLKDYSEKDDINVNDFFFRWPIVHTRYKELQRLDFVEFAPNKFLRGEQIIFEAEEVYPPYISESLNPSELSDTNLKWLNDLYDLSVAENFKLIFMKTPYYPDEKYQSMVDAVSVFAREKGLDFLDLNKYAAKIGFDYSRDFLDANHTNAYGARKLSSFITDYLLSKYDFEDHRSDSRYSQWEEDLEYYYREELKNKMENAGNIYEMMNLFFDKSFKDFTAVVSVEYASGINEEYYDAFYGTDMEYDDFMMGGKWIYKDGTFTKLISNGTEEVPQIYDFNNHDTLTVRYTGDGKVGNTTIGKDDYSNIGTFFSVIIYDDLLETVAEHKLY